MANVPTPPEPAWIRNLWPFFRLARSINTCQAVRPTKGIEAASSMVRFLGFSATSASFMAMNSANVPIVAVRASNVFQKLEDPEPTLVKLRQKIQDLEAQELAARDEGSTKG